MWPFSRSSSRVGNWLTPSQAQQAIKVYYTDLDEGCWFAAVLLPQDEAIRLAVSTEEEARETAQALADEVFAKSGRRLSIQKGR